MSAASAYNAARHMTQPGPVTPVIIREVPPKTPEVSVADVLMSSLGLVGVILVGALLFGLCAGGLFIAFRRWRERRNPDPDERAIRLDLSAPPR